MCNLATTFLNFGLALGARPSLPKIQNCGSNECLKLVTPVIPSEEKLLQVHII